MVDLWKFILILLSFLFPSIQTKEFFIKDLLKNTKNYIIYNIDNKNFYLEINNTFYNCNLDDLKCYKDKLKRYKFYYYVECNGILKPTYVKKTNNYYEISINKNCCNTFVFLKFENNSFIIKEIPYGILCKCICNAKIKLFYKENVKIYFNKRLIYPKEFCGISTYGYCRNDEDCVVQGCNKEVCASKRERIFTPCIYKECYKNVGYECKCIKNKCQWVKK